jgi:uncharacterized iron-regulated membrane protein
MAATTDTGASQISGSLRLLAMTGVRWLVIAHRWLGIGVCVLCALWFVTGVVMIYVPYPSFTDRDRAAYAEPLALQAVKLSPDEALAAAKAEDFPGQFRLVMLRGEPVYRLTAGRQRIAISAVDGRRIERVNAEAAADLVRRVLPDRQLGKITTIVRDPWTVQPSGDPYRPLHKVRVEGPEGLDLYISSKTGEVVADTTRKERVWNYVGSIVHWLYLPGVRQSNDLWHAVIVWTSGPAIVSAASGIWLGILRLRLRRRAGASVSPYRGWMKWHHITGLIGGLFVATWLISGWLSVNPFKLFAREQTSPAAMARYAGHDGASFDTTLKVLTQLPPGAREARLTWIGGRPLVVLTAADASQTAFDARTGASAGLTDQSLFASARALQPGAPVAFATRLTAPDDYWYSFRLNQRRLPVLRVGFADTHRTWFHIDPTTGEVLSRTNDSGRAYRWWFNLLHDLDLPILVNRRPLWDLVMWGLSILGLIVSVSGAVIGWRRLKLKFGLSRRPSKLAASLAAQSKS